MTTSDPSGWPTPEPHPWGDPQREPGPRDDDDSNEDIDAESGDTDPNPDLPPVVDMQSASPPLLPTTAPVEDKQFWGDQLAAVPPQTPTSPKVIFATIAAGVAPAILAVLFFLQTDDGGALLGGLPILVRIFLQALIVAAATFITGYMKRDTLREQGAAYVARRARAE